MAAEGQSNKMVYDVEVRVKQRCVTEFLNAEKMVPIDIQCLWRTNSGYVHSEVVGACFNSNDNNVKFKPYSYSHAYSYKCGMRGLVH